MLMNTKLGRRVADDCITPEQALASITPGPAPASKVELDESEGPAY